MEEWETFLRMIDIATLQKAVPEVSAEKLQDQDSTRLESDDKEVGSCIYKGSIISRALRFMIRADSTYVTKLERICKE